MLASCSQTPSHLLLSVEKNNNAVETGKHDKVLYLQEEDGEKGNSSDSRKGVGDS